MFVKDARKVSSRPVILDGGMGKELKRIGAPFDQPEWSALALMEAPETVLQAHNNFIEAGAEVILANAYAVVPFHIGEQRFAHRGLELCNLAGRLARQAADEAPGPVSVGGVLPPLFGSYLPENFDPQRAPEMWRVLIEGQAKWVDFWAAETLGSCEEATAIVAALERAGDPKPRWLSFSLADNYANGKPVLWSGETVAEAAQTAASLKPETVLLNCAAPEAITDALPDLVRELGQAGSTAAVGAYANGFEPRPEEYSANEVILERREDLTGPVYADIARGWVQSGATIIGGCCGMHPEHIAALAAEFSTEPRVNPGSTASYSPSA